MVGRRRRRRRRRGRPPPSSPVKVGRGSGGDEMFKLQSVFGRESENEKMISLSLSEFSFLYAVWVDYMGATWPLLVAPLGWSTRGSCVDPSITWWCTLTPYLLIF